MPPTAYKSSNCLGWHPGPSLPPSLIHHSSVSYTLSVSPSESFENPYTAKPALLFPMCKSSRMSRISLAALDLPLLKLCNLLSLFYNHLCISDSFD